LIPGFTGKTYKPMGELQPEFGISFTGLLRIGSLDTKNKVMNRAGFIAQKFFISSKDINKLIF
jgi:hypothetical protein